MKVNFFYFTPCIELNFTIGIKKRTFKKVSANAENDKIK